MSIETPVAKLPIAWLRELPEGYQIPLWRWILLPFAAWMLKRTGGVWISGELRLMQSRIEFVPSRLIKSRGPSETWMIQLQDIEDVDVQKGIASERLKLRHDGRSTTLMAARSAEFVAQLTRAINA